MKPHQEELLLATARTLRAFMAVQAEQTYTRKWQDEIVDLKNQLDEALKAFQPSDAPAVSLHAKEPKKSAVV